MMKATSIRLCALIVSCFAVLPCIAGTFTPLEWQTTVVEIESVPEGPFEVAVGFDRCLPRKELKQLRDNGKLLVESDLISAAVFRFASRDEFDLALASLASSLDGLGPRPSVLQFGPMWLGHGTSVRGHEARESPRYSGSHPYERCIRGKKVGIAIVDSGVAAEHIQLDDTGWPEPRWVAGYDALKDTETDPQPKILHGSAVAGIALGKDFPHLLYRCRTHECGGMAPEAGLIDIKITDSTQIQVSEAMEGLRWLAAHYDTANRDLHVPASCARDPGPRIAPGGDYFSTPNVVANLSFFDCDDDPTGISVLAQEANALVASGIPVVVAHGNASSCGFPSRCDGACTERTWSPGSARDVITVAGTDDMGKVDRRYHRPFCDGICGPRPNEKPDLSASAELVMAPSLIDGVFDLYARRSGTSIAAAHVSGAVALVKSARPTMDPVSIKHDLIHYADRQHNPERKYWDRELGWGILKLDWLTDLAAKRPDELADLTFAGCLRADSDGPLSDCRLEDPATPWWRNNLGIQVQENSGTMEVTVHVVNNGPWAVSALVRLEGYDRVIGNHQYYHLGDRIVDLPVGPTEATVSFQVTDPRNPSRPRLRHFRASVHSAWDRSYSDNRTQFNIDASGTSTEFLIDSPFRESAELNFQTTRGCVVLDPDKQEVPPEEPTRIEPGECPRIWTLARADERFAGGPDRKSEGKCVLSVSGGPDGRDALDLGGIQLVPY